LIKKAGQFARLKIAQADGARYDRDLTPHLSRAVRKLSALRDAGQPICDYLKIGNLFGEDLLPIERRILIVFEQYKLSARVLEEILEGFISRVESFGHPDQMLMAARPVPPMAELFEDAVSLVTPARPIARKTKAQTKSAWDRGAAARKAWITIRANRASLAQAA
jgi:hypothetical protein